MRTGSNGLYVVLVSVHGLIRSHNLELGRDADTGGQTKYVVELARALAQHPAIERVDLVTRLVRDAAISADYAQPIEPICDKAQIVRLECGPDRYIRKEELWPYLDAFAEALQGHLAERRPSLLHSHYADAGYVAVRVGEKLRIPLIHTGHSLGRVKQRRLLENGSDLQAMEAEFCFAQRFAAEEMALAHADLVITSTDQEIEEQYRLYEHYYPDRMHVIPPGLDLTCFYPPGSDWSDPPIAQELGRFLLDPDKPMILALSRPSPNKNVGALVKAYGEDPELRQLANLVLVLGNRDDIGAMEDGPQQVLTDLLLAIDRYDLHGHVAYPKHHLPDDVPDLYRLATQTQGVFVNPALSEPFGLTLIEAAASGLPVIATPDGGPRDILANCQNGLLVDPQDPFEIGQALRKALTQPRQWLRWSRNGLTGAQVYSWPKHVEQYLYQIDRLLAQPHLAGSSYRRASHLPATRQSRISPLKRQSP